MSKLIYSATSALLEGSYTGIKDSDQLVNSVYYSIAFTGDGYMYTHGKKFRLFKVDNNGVGGFQFSIDNGIARMLIDGTSIGSGTVVQAVTGDNIVVANTTNGEVSLSHKQYLSLNSPTTYGSAVKIPIITLDKYGHITNVSEGASIDVTQVQAQTTTTAGNYYLTGVTNANLQNPIYHTGVYFDNQGNLYANNIYFNGDDISGQFAPLSHTSVGATDSVLGHVTLSDSYSNSATTSVAATPRAVYSALAASKTYTENLIAAQDAMIFVGTIDSTGVIKAHNDNVLTAIDDTTTIAEIPYEVGWTFRFASAGTFYTEKVEAGDMIIAVKDKSTNFAIADWTIIQTNINGALTSTANLNGLLYASNSRNVQSLAFGSGVLKSDGSSIEFVNPNTLWRAIQINGTSIGTNIFNLKSGSNLSLTNDNGEVTINVSASGIISNSASLTLTQDSTSFIYHPSSASTLNIGQKLTLKHVNDTYTLEHAAITAINGKFGKVTTDGYGHVTNVEEVTSMPSQYGLKIKHGNTEFIDYKGDAEKILKIVNGTDISLTLSTEQDGTVVLTPSITHKYRPVQFFASPTAESATALLPNNEDTILTLVGGENVTLQAGQTSGTLIINAEDTWRDIQAYKFSNNVMSRSSIPSALYFSNDFLYSDDELGLVWTEIDANGRITYAK